MSQAHTTGASADHPAGAGQLTRLHVLLVILGAVVATALALLLRPDDTNELGSAEGATVDLIEDQVLWPVEWKGNDTITFQTTTGTTTVRIDGTVVARTTNPASASEPALAKLDPDAVFGSWRSWEGGIYLVRTDEKCGPPLLISPDGKLVACRHAIHGQTERNGLYGAVVRLD